MSPNLVCPSCGAALEDNVGNSCPYCGSALNFGSSAPTIIAMPKKKKAESSAEAMDEVKKLVREGDEATAAEVASAEFGLDAEAAKTTVEQVATDMEHSGSEPAPVQPEPTPVKPIEPEPFVPQSSPVGQPPKPPSKTNPWVIGGAAAVIFLCLCCCLPTLIAIVAMARNR